MTTWPRLVCTLNMPVFRRAGWRRVTVLPWWTQASTRRHKESRFTSSLLLACLVRVVCCRQVYTMFLLYFPWTGACVDHDTTVCQSHLCSTRCLLVRMYACDGCFWRPNVIIPAIIVTLLYSISLQRSRWWLKGVANVLGLCVLRTMSVMLMLCLLWSVLFSLSCLQMGWVILSIA